MVFFKKIIKVCKIEDFAFGKFAHLCGADYLGIHVIKERDIGRYLDLAQALKLLNSKIIIVTKIAQRDQLKKIIELYQPEGLQLHFKPDLHLLEWLGIAYPKLEIFSVITDELCVRAVERVFSLSSKIIYDSSFRGGTGKSNNLRLVNKLKKEVLPKVILAGGINLDFIKSFRGYDIGGIDIQSFLQNDGRRYFNRIESIFRLTKSPHRQMLSISVTDWDIRYFSFINFNQQPNFNYHIDYSDGSLYPNFTTDKKDTFWKIDKLARFPLVMHIFGNDEYKINDLINEFDADKGNAISSFFIQYFPGLNLEKIKKDINIVVSLYYRDLEDYIGNWHDFTDFLSINLPSNDPVCTDKILTYINQNSNYFSNKELWFDRELNRDKIAHLKEVLSMPFNVIVGKAIAKRQNDIDEIYKEL